MADITAVLLGICGLVAALALIFGLLIYAQNQLASGGQGGGMAEAHLQKCAIAFVAAGAAAAVVQATNFAIG